MKKVDWEIIEGLKGEVEQLNRFNELRENNKEAIKLLKAFNKDVDKWDTDEFSQSNMYDEIENIINILKGQKNERR